MDVKNIFEIQRIRTILCEHPDLLSMFELLVIMSNERLNSYSSKEDTKKIILEENIGVWDDATAFVFDIPPPICFTR